MSYICGDCHQEHKVPKHEEDEIAATSGTSGMSCILALVRERKELLLQVSELQKKLAEEEGAHERTMIERDGWEEALTQLAADAGCEEEWSNLHAHGDCITNLWDAKVKAAGVVEKPKCECPTYPHRPGCDQIGVFCLDHRKVMIEGVCPKCAEKRVEGA